MRSMDQTALDLLRAQPKGTLHDRMGGKRGLYAAVDRFYAKVLEDPDLRLYFATTDMERMKAHQAVFLSYTFGGPAYEAPDLSRAHRGLAIEGAHFDRMIDYALEALMEMGLQIEDLLTAALYLETYRPQIVAGGRAAGADET